MHGWCTCRDQHVAISQATLLEKGGGDDASVVSCLPLLLASVQGYNSGRQGPLILHTCLQ